MAIWTICECKNCDGSGWLYCWRCSERCEHDRICPMCAGYGEVPEKQTGLRAFVAQTFEHFSTKKAALEWIKLDW